MKHMKCIFGAMMALVLIFFATSCTMESDESGALGGYWHLTAVDTLATGGTTALENQLIFWSIQGTILQVSDQKNKEKDRIIFRYETDGNKLSIKEPRLSRRLEGDPLVDDITMLTPYGIHALTETFTIESNQSGKMVLKSSVLRLHLLRR